MLIYSYYLRNIFIIVILDKNRLIDEISSFDGVDKGGLSNKV